MNNRNTNQTRSDIDELKKSTDGKIDLQIHEELIIGIIAGCFQMDEQLCQEFLDWIKVYPNPSEQDLIVMAMEVAGELDDKEEAGNRVNGRTKQVW